jgi:hypothetical protein
MVDTQETPDQKDSSPWIQATLERAVREIARSGAFESDMIEARPIWSIPERILIGQMRETGDPANFRWVICGAVPTDLIASSVAATPRDALRYFSLKWQLGAARLGDPATRKAAGQREQAGEPEKSAQLATIAEELYAIVEDDRLWPDTGPL